MNSDFMYSFINFSLKSNPTSSNENLIKPYLDLSKVSFVNPTVNKGKIDISDLKNRYPKSISSSVTFSLSKNTYLSLSSTIMFLKIQSEYSEESFNLFLQSIFKFVIFSITLIYLIKKVFNS